MLLYNSDKNYGVHLEEDGDDLWITVTNGYCNRYDCIVGTVGENDDIRACVDAAYSQFFPAQYISDSLDANDDRARVLFVARDAYEIDRALEMALASYQ